MGTLLFCVFTTRQLKSGVKEVCPLADQEDSYTTPYTQNLTIDQRIILFLTKITILESFFNVSLIQLSFFDYYKRLEIFMELLLLFTYKLLSQWGSRPHFFSNCFCSINDQKRIMILGIGYEL